MLDKELFQQLDCLIQLFVCAWKKQEEELELKKRDAESLYKMKSKTEEEEIEEHFKQLFPNFQEQDFSDINTKNIDDAPEYIHSEAYAGTISTEDIKFVYNLHKQLLQLYTKSEWLKPEKQNVHGNFVEPLMEKFKLFKLILKKSVECLDYTMDNELLGSFNVLIAIEKYFGETQALDKLCTSSPTASQKRRVNFYKDSNVDEVKGSYHILEDLRLKIIELLSEWPEHPTLQKIDSIINRIYGFSITSPLTRFLTGFETLLTICHDWEQNAHSGVSLSQHVQNLVQQIISWRKLEMNMWKNSLNNVYERLNDNVMKWWVFIYNTMQQFIYDNSCQVQDLIETLQKFMIQSNLAEFRSRLQLLYLFHCHAVHLKQTEKRGIFISVLWNLHEYYEQFVTSVEAKIKELRTPIEKKLKDYIKIVRWKDISYWAIKETLEKTQKTMHKHIRQFEDVLKQPVSTYLVNTNSDIQNDASIGIWDRPQRHFPKSYHYTMDASTYMAKQSLFKKLQINQENYPDFESSILLKTEKYFYKSRQLCKDIILSTKYPKLIQGLDSFIGDIIETSNHLQKLEVDSSLPKIKQKSQAKSILQQKRKALSELFKNLSTIGLSYRTGIIKSKLKDVSTEFLIKPIDLNASFGHLKNSRNDEKLLTIWEGCELYFMRSLMRLDVLETVLKNPAKDLGSQNAERCLGFSVHLLDIAQEQKSKLIESSRIFYYLKSYSTSVIDVCEAKYLKSIAVLNNTKEYLKKVIIIMEQYKVVLQTCPEETTFGSSLMEIPLLQSKYSQFMRNKGDEVWIKTYSQINDVISISEKLLLAVEKCKNLTPSAEYQFVQFQYANINETDIISVLDEICCALNEIKNVFGDIPIMNSLNQLLVDSDKLQVFINQSENDENSKISSKKFTYLIKNLTEKTLIVIQNMFKKYEGEMGSLQDKNNSEDQEHAVLLNENHLKSQVVDNLISDMKILEMNNILKCLHNVVAEFNSANLHVIVVYKVILSQIMPLMEQIILLYQYFITQQVSAYRVTCKMSSIILNIFIDLATKGFCVPPEFSDDFDTEGQTQKAGDGFGLSEGQGERDVSDRIESEDQLDDAQPANQEKQTNEEQNSKEEDKGIEMSEDFDANLQDTEKKNDDDNHSNADSDADEQMGETNPNADTLDQQIWGSDDEESEEQKEEKGGKGEKQSDGQLAANENESKNNDEEQQDPSKGENKEKNDINKMDEREYDPEQTDPYHGNHPEYPEPEPMDLPDDLELDDNAQEEESQVENPFDIDAMKEQMSPKEPPKQEQNENNEDVNENHDASSDEDSSDEDNLSKDKDDNQDINTEEQSQNIENDEKVDELNKKESEETECETENKQTALDQTQSSESQTQAMDVTGTTDNVEVNQNEPQKQMLPPPNEQTYQEDNPDKEGVGHSQMEESTTGHKGQSTTDQDLESNRDDSEIREQKRKPGESDSKRSLGDASEQVKKKLKTMNLQDSEESENLEDENSKQDKSTDLFQHIKEAKETDYQQVLDTATKEQIEEQKDIINPLKDENNESTENTDKLHDYEDEELEINEIVKQKPEKLESTDEKQKLKNNQPNLEGELVDEMQAVDIEGEVTSTTTVLRGPETTYHTQYDNLQGTNSVRLSADEMHWLRTEIEQQLSMWNEPPTNAEAEQTWEKISSVTSSLAQDLSEQLRLVLEPTQASRLKGDYRTGRRINMRKVIPYIASQFRKDKIWLRRTKLSKRDYQIVLAIDDSSSMADNHSKELAFESVALISKALTLLESGQLSVLSFGETPEVLHKLTDTFTEKSGSKLLQKFQFNQNKTCIGQLVNFVTEMLSLSHLQGNALLAKLLIIVSDGRGIFWEGQTYVQQAIRRAKLSNVFMVFIVIDNPENKDSILDIRMPIFSEGKLLGIKSYMDSFPFPFYIILRDINSLPSILSDALRQWFEIVTNMDAL